MRGPISHQQDRGSRIAPDTKEETSQTEVRMEMQVGDHVIGQDHPTFFVIEEGQANEGKYELALRMIELAAQSGAAAIEFQFAVADDFYVRTHHMHAIYKAREFSQEQLVGLRQAAEQRRILISASPLSDRLMERLVDAGYTLFNINASDIVNPRMLDAVAETGMPFMVGTSMATIEEIDWAVERLRCRGCGAFCLLHGQHVMTTSEGRGVPESEVSLTTIRYLRDRYRLPVGFTDHTSSEIIPALAVANGAVVVTKHLAPQPGWRGPDWQVCLTPDKMTECLQLVRLADATKGSPEKALALGELADRDQMRRSIVAKFDLAAGTILKSEHLLLKRPGTGLDQRQLDSVVGKTLVVSIKKDDQIRLEYLTS